ERQAEDETDRGVALGLGEQRRRVGAELGAVDGKQRRGDLAPYVRHRETDGLGPEIEAEERTGLRQRGKVGGHEAVANSQERIETKIARASPRDLLFAPLFARTTGYCRYCWIRVVRRPARPCSSIDCCQERNS